MSYDEDRLRERVKKLYANTFEEELFKISFGTVAVNTGCSIIGLSFLAQAVTTLAYQDDAYCATLVAVLPKFQSMERDFRRVVPNTLDHHYAMIAGTIIEIALVSLAELRKEDQQ